MPSALWRPLSLALGVGVLLGGLWAGWQREHLAQLQTQRSRLQAEAQVLARQQAATTALRARRQLQQDLQARAQAWQTGREQLHALQHTLGVQAQVLGLRVQRWQADGRQLVLQGWLPRAQDVPALMSALSAVGPQGWTLHSLGETATPASEGGVEVVLQAPWPPSPPARGKDVP